MTSFEEILVRLEYTNILITYDTLKRADFQYKRFKDICYRNNIDIKCHDFRRTIQVGKNMLKFTGDMSYAQMRDFNGLVLHGVSFLEVWE